MFGVSSSDRGSDGRPAAGFGGASAKPIPASRGGSSWETTVSAASVESIREIDPLPGGATDQRRFRYWLHDRLHQILPFGSREHACHHVAADGGVVSLNRETGKARYRGVYRCENPWVCPLCAPVVQAARAEQVAAVLRWGHAEGALFFKVAKTAGHALGDPLSGLMDRISKASRSFQSSRAVRGILKDLGFMGSITSKEATWGPSSGWHPHQHEYWMCNPRHGVDLEDVGERLSREWVKACQRQGLNANPAFAFWFKRMNPDEIEAGTATGYLTKSGTAAGYLTKSGTAASLELAGGASKKGTKPHKQGHFAPMELLAMDQPWADALFLEFYHAFKGRKQVVFSRSILKIYGDLFGTMPGEDGEIVQLEERKKPDEEDVLQLQPGQLAALRESRQAVRVLELVEAGRAADARRLVESVWDASVMRRYRAAVDWYRKRGLFDS